jgi:hypothetical protein
MAPPNLRLTFEIFNFFSLYNHALPCLLIFACGGLGRRWRRRSKLEISVL